MAERKKNGKKKLADTPNKVERVEVSQGVSQNFKIDRYLGESPAEKVLQRL